jgi:5-methylcytosine-specific restriction endonuclease McrA
VTWQPRTTPSPYDAAWRRMRLLILDRDGWTCRVCGVNLRTPGIGATVDHVISLAERPDLRLDPFNLRAACRRCNHRLGSKLGHARSRGRQSASRVIRYW